MGYAVICDDYDPCTDHGCNPQIGCEHTPRDTDDGDFCTIDDCNSDGIITLFLLTVMITTLVLMTAVAKKLELANTENIDCDDHDACTIDGCDVTNGCTYSTVICLYTPCATECCDKDYGC